MEEKLKAIIEGMKQENADAINAGRPEIYNDADFDSGKLSFFESKISEIMASSTWLRSDLVDLFHEMIPGFGHKETGKFLDQKM